MHTQDQKIPCPVCNTSIQFDVKQLLSGMQFTCPNCFASIGLADESRPLVQETMEKIDQLRSGSPRGHLVNNPKK